MHLVLLSILPWLMMADSDRWPQYRGPNGSGIAEESAPVEFDLKNSLLWQTELPQGHSSPSIWGAHIVLTGFDPETKKLQVIDIDRVSGRARWRSIVDAAAIEKVHAVSSPATATPVVDGERVYTYFGSSGLAAFDLDGKQIWSVPMSVANIGYGSGTSPILAGEAIILAREDKDDSFMLAVDRKTGRELWKKQFSKGTGFQTHATPVIWKEQVVLHQPAAVRAYGLSDGSLKWSFAINSQGTGTPVVDGDTLYVGAWFGEASLRDPWPDWKTMLEKYDTDHDGSLSKEEFPADLAITRRIDAGNTPGAVVTFKMFFDSMLDRNKDGQVSKDEWTFAMMAMSMSPGAHGILAIRLGGTGDVTKTNLLWTEERGVPEVPTPLAYRGRLYVVTNGGIVTVLDSASGKLIYRARLGAGGLYYSSPIAAGGRIYFASGEGVVTVVDAAADELKVLAHNDLGEAIFATPAIVDGKIYVRTAGHLYAFGN